MSERPRHEEIDESNPDQPSGNPRDEQGIYEDGNLLKIRIEELANNPVAIRQLVNSNNISRKEVQEIKKTLVAKEVELSFLQTTPFAGILSMFINVAGSVLLSIAVNLITGSQQASVSGILLWTGIALLILGSTTPIVYPYVNRIFKRKAS